MHHYIYLVIYLVGHFNHEDLLLLLPMKMIVDDHTALQTLNIMAEIRPRKLEIEKTQR